MFKIKKFVAIILVAVIALLPCSNAFANDVVKTATFNGITYKILESYDSNGSKVVTVTGNGETNIVVNDGVNITITKIKKDKTQSTIQKEIKYETEPSLAAISSTGSLYTTFWNYSYYWSDNSFNSSGIWWSLSSGNTYGSAAHFDNRDLTARDYAERFMADVNDIQNQQVGAIAALGFAAASAIAAALTAETGIGGVVGIVLALGGTIGSAGFWVSAYTSSVSANYNFSQFKNVLRIY